MYKPMSGDFIDSFAKFGQEVLSTAKDVLYQAVTLKPAPAPAPAPQPTMVPAHVVPTAEELATRPSTTYMQPTEGLMGKLGPVLLVGGGVAALYYLFMRK